VTDFESEQNQPEEINLEVESSDYAETDPAYIDDTNADEQSAEELALRPCELIGTCRTCPGKPVNAPRSYGHA
jgi:hypothetical protein